MVSVAVMTVKRVLLLISSMDYMQDFLSEVDLQFLDHMRRGTSINFADLASDPPPATMQVSQCLKCDQHFHRHPHGNLSKL